MQNTMVKKSNLIIPVGAVELSKDEMQYVDGGMDFNYLGDLAKSIGDLITAVGAAIASLGLFARLAAQALFIIFKGCALTASTGVGVALMLASFGGLAAFVGSVAWVADEWRNVVYYGNKFLFG